MRVITMHEVENRTKVQIVYRLNFEHFTMYSKDEKCGNDKFGAERQSSAMFIFTL